MDGNANGKPVVLFDSYCNLCCGFTGWVLKRDYFAKLLFAPLQGETAKIIFAEMCYHSPPADSVILVQDGSLFTRSTAVLRIFRILGAPWSWLYPLVYIPSPLRDFFYRLIAGNRYRIFGKRENCHAPGSDQHGRFLP